MKKWITLALLISSFSVVADDINQYKYFQTDNIVPNGRAPHYEAYIKNNDPCIFVNNLRENTIEKYCKLDESGYDLEVNYPSVYPVDLRLSGSSLYFIAAAPWNEQKCEIFFPKKSIICESTGR